MYAGSDLLSIGVLRPVPEQQLRILLTRVQSPYRHYNTQLSWSSPHSQKRNNTLDTPPGLPLHQKGTYTPWIPPGLPSHTKGVLRPVPEQQLRILLTRVQSPYGHYNTQLSWSSPHSQKRNNTLDTPPGLPLHQKGTYTPWIPAGLPSHTKGTTIEASKQEIKPLDQTHE
ncbi:hypothetical protein Taro_052984, partial [Colocasia esculenta]|nr:hypothetical protein [Colocasia esculenta]